MSDAQRERRPLEEAARDAETVEGGYAPSTSGASVAPERPRSDAGRDLERAERHEDPKDESDRVPATSARSEASPIEIRVVGRTDVGLVREHNEDNYLLAELEAGGRDPSTFQRVPAAGLMLAVCDGMGGAAAGEVASQMAVDTLYEMMRKGVPSPDRDEFARTLVHSIEEAGTRIFESARADRSKRGMGTTATVAALMDKTLFVGQVGDSRAYVLRGGELKQVTKDQSLVNQLIEAGQLTEDEAEAFEHSNIILQALGTTEQVSVDLTFLELRRGDRLLLCSDGLSGLVHGDVIRDVMIEQRDLAACCERLIELAKAGGGHDNITVLLAEFGGEALAEPQPSDLFGYQQYPLPLDPERPLVTSSPHSEIPTLAPPSLRPPPPDDELERPRESRPPQGGSSSAGRLFLFAMLIVGAAGAIYYWMAARQQHGPPAEALPLSPTPEEVEPARVEVLVRTDVEGGELLVDGESYGLASDGRWVLELTAGPHRLEARAGGSVVTTSLVTVRRGVPATVLLSMPEGASLTGADAGVEPAGEPLKNGRTKRERGALLSEEVEARHARRAARERARLAGDASSVLQEGSERATVRDEPAREPAAPASDVGKEPGAARPAVSAPPPSPASGRDAAK